MYLQTPIMAAPVHRHFICRARRTLRAFVRMGLAPICMHSDGRGELDFGENHIEWHREAGAIGMDWTRADGRTATTPPYVLREWRTVCGTMEKVERAHSMLDKPVLVDDAKYQVEKLRLELGRKYQERDTRMDAARLGRVECTPAADSKRTLRVIARIKRINDVELPKAHETSQRLQFQYAKNEHKILEARRIVAAVADTIDVTLWPPLVAAACKVEC